jgi:hypothetical protein
MLTPFHSYLTRSETKNYAYIKNDMRLGSENSDNGLIDTNTCTNAWPLFFPRVFNLNITTDGKAEIPVFHLYSSMGLENSSGEDVPIAEPESNIYYSTYLKNYSYYTFNAPESYFFRIATSIIDPVAFGHPLNLSGGIGALDGCVPVYNPETNDVYLLGGRQITNKDNINNTFTTKTNVISIGDFDKLYTQPYGIKFNTETTGRKAVRQRSDALTEFDIIDDVLPYAALYSDALYIEQFKAWLVPTTALPIDDQNTDLPPMLMIELFEGQTNESLQIQNRGKQIKEKKMSRTKKPIVLSRITSPQNMYIHNGLIFRITPLFTQNYGYVKAIKNSPNIDIGNPANGNTIGRNWGDHFIYIDEKQNVCYVNLATKQAFKITREQMTFTSIAGHVEALEDIVSLRLEPES